MCEDLLEALTIISITQRTDLYRYSLSYTTPKFRVLTFSNFTGGQNEEENVSNDAIHYQHAQSLSTV